jgi:hypothetical protein
MVRDSGVLDLANMVILAKRARDVAGKSIPGTPGARKRGCGQTGG